MDSVYGPLEEMFDLNNDGKLDPIEFGVMMEVINGEDEDSFFEDKDDNDLG